ncbi:MAG: dienelactone hydrolase [Alphaproteobacteria bacterium RIFOXYD12_FULL_60_8]|nr:MAG: dienelactone hydrolase [Alphaproteobacteria bacterium RIFOXYD12_FULL_60_8]
MLKRRTLIKTLAGIPLAAILADSKLAHATAQTLETVGLTTSSGLPVSAALALPKVTPAPAVLLIHEWTGLNDQIKSMAHEFAREGYVALAIDLYKGQVATDIDTAKKYMNEVDAVEATQTLTAWIDWLRASSKVNGKVATCGWCFGGGWSLNASIAAPVDATVIYYGRVTRKAEELARLHGPVLGHFATLDKTINAEMVGGFEQEMKAAGKDKTLTVHWYEADHAFANATGARYDDADAKLAWQRTLAFLKSSL